MDECCDSFNYNKTALRCPLCGGTGQSVSYITVKSLVMNGSGTELKDEFYICSTPSCDVVYFSYNTVFNQREIIVPVYWKDGANPRFVCYCNRITEEEIIKVVIHGNARTVKDITRLTGATRNGKCLNNNPKGVCCHKDIETIIQRTLENMGSI